MGRETEKMLHQPPTPIRVREPGILPPLVSCLPLLSRAGVYIEAAPGVPAIVLCHCWGGTGRPRCVTCVHLQRERGQSVGFGVGLGWKG